MANPQNAECAALYENDLEQFRVMAQNCVTDWKERLYAVSNDDPHYMNFSVFDPAVHGPVRERMKTKMEDEEEEEGEEGGGSGGRKSYVAPGALQIFSEPISPVSIERPSSMPK